MNGQPVQAGYLLPVVVDNHRHLAERTVRVIHDIALAQFRAADLFDELQIPVVVFAQQGRLANTDRRIVVESFVALQQHGGRSIRSQVTELG